MIGIVGILGCGAIAIAIIGAAVTIVTSVVGGAISKNAADEDAARAKNTNKANLERQKQAEIVQLRQMQLAQARAMQSSAQSAFCNSLQAESDRLEAKDLKKKLHGSGQTPIARPTRNYGTVI